MAINNAIIQTYNSAFDVVNGVTGAAPCSNSINLSVDQQGRINLVGLADSIVTGANNAATVKTTFSQIQQEIVSILGIGPTVFVYDYVQLQDGNWLLVYCFA
jgi:hypothetical protein